MKTDEFIRKWKGATASELATAQSFVIDLCELLGVPRPDPAGDGSYTFERPVTFQHGDGTASPGRIDCYRRGSFVLEAKKLRPNAGAQVFDDAMLRARAQAEGYARALPAAEGRPPFVVLVDVGNVIELYSEFTRSGATYTPFPDARSHRIPLDALSQESMRARLAALWTDPDSLNPARASARVTREVAGLLATLAKSLEAAGHRADHVAAFLTRCLFSMFAEDVELLPKGADGTGGFLGLLQRHQEQPDTLTQMLRALWFDMDRGGFSPVLAQQVLRFNGKLFKNANADGYVLPLSGAQVGLLLQAAKCNWREVEPAIFGTLLERALDPTERHALGAHYTPRAYVERLVLPTVMEPLRADWADAQAAALVLASAGDFAGARTEVRRFHHQLCTVRVLDPACGSGNFLYVTLEHLKRLEGEVLDRLATFGQDTDAAKQDALALEGETVTLQQLRGVEINERAAALAELVLWIGYLQWHIRTRGNQAVAEPVVHDYGNIECRDAVLDWDDLEPAFDAPDPQTGTRLLLSRWDGQTFKPHAVTGELVPDENAQVPQWRYIRPRKAVWPEANFVVGNPPFIGKLKMREALGDGYVEALRSVWRGVPESADFVMYWWHHCADLLVEKKIRAFGLITTNSITMIFNRRIVQNALDRGVGITYAIPDHPWVDDTTSAAVRVAMTVASTGESGTLAKVVRERVGDFGEAEVELASSYGCIHANLHIGAAITSAAPLRGNEGISCMGFLLGGRGFVLTAPQAELLSAGGGANLIHPLLNGSDVTGEPRGLFVIDADGMTHERLMETAPAIWQHLRATVYPERLINKDARLSANWWLFRRSNAQLRGASAGLRRFIVSSETAKHRAFIFVSGTSRPEHKLVVLTLDGAHHLGVLSSRVHVQWALAAGGRLGVGNDPVYSKSTCFDPFPFPSSDTGLTTDLQARVGALAEQIDRHRKRAQAEHPGMVTLTGIYNVMEALRQGHALTDKERAVHDAGLVSVLRELHTELDAAVLSAYGWSDLADGLAQGPHTCTLDGDPPAAFEAARSELLTRLVALNARRAAAEAQGRVQWLRPEFQNPASRVDPATVERSPRAASGRQVDLVPEADPIPVADTLVVQPWPTTLPAQVRAVAQVLEAGKIAMALPVIETRFKGRGPWKRSLPRILETLEALGRARREGDAWRA